MDDQEYIPASLSMHDDIKRNNTAPEIPELLSVADVQAVFNRSARTIRRWVKRGFLTPVQMGRSLFFRREDIERVIRDQLRQNGSG